MKFPTSKQHKQKISRSGNSQFIRSKLDQQYNPAVRFFKPNLMSFNGLEQKDKHQYMARQQSRICDRALSEVKKGVRITLDWNTRTNFRTTKSMLPKVKTMPIESVCQRLEQMSQKNLESSIDKKSKQLSKLLFKRQKKLYMLNNRERQYQKRLLGDRCQLQRNSRTQEHSSDNGQHSEQSQNRTRKPLIPGKNKSVQEVQDRILNNSKLKILKEQLKVKFHQIRGSFHKNRQIFRHPLSNFLLP